MLSQIVEFLVSTVESWGYFGVFFLMFVESSFFIPFPSEVVMIPAGYLAFSGKMSLLWAFVAGTAGSLAGALCNYYICYFFGRPLVAKYGKYVRITPEKMAKFEAFFNKYGDISTFNCRLIPGIRQYISLPAGLAKMNMFKFCLYTSLGAGLWVAVLLAVGYLIGDNQELIKEEMPLITVAALGFVVLVTLVYFFVKRKQKRGEGESV